MMPPEHVASPKNRLDLSSIGVGAGVGLALVLLTTAAAAAYAAPSSRGGLVLLEVVVVYLPAGYAAGRRVAHVRRAEAARQRLAPPGVHALAAGAVLAVLHALVRVATNAGITPALWGFVTEAVLATLVAGAAGLFATRRPG